jgi:hypothetical protein
MNRAKIIILLPLIALTAIAWYVRPLFHGYDYFDS